MSNFVLIPCAGSGSRFSAKLPKQYVSIAGKTVIEHTIQAFLALETIDHIILIASPGDMFIDRYSELSNKISIFKVGGSTRAISVLNGLNKLKCKDDDWILVHDAARCCVLPDSIANLLEELGSDNVGGILALPVTDTLKLGVDNIITRTIDRQNMYQAQTPQMFRYAVLLKALSQSDLNKITDEAGAVENMGLKVRLVKGEATNIKLTYPADLVLAEFFLSSKNG